MNENGTMAKGEDLFKFAQKHKLHIGKIERFNFIQTEKRKIN